MKRDLLKQKNRKYQKKTLPIKEYIEDYYTNAIKPMKLSIIARHFGVSYEKIASIVNNHSLYRTGEHSILKAIDLVREGYLTDKQIKDITGINIDTIKDMRKELDNEQNLGD